jgi:hypothetical protein
MGMEDTSGAEEIKNKQIKIASILFTVAMIGITGWGIVAYLMYYSIILINPTLELVALILMWIFVITLFIGLFLHPKTRETIRMANKESATKLKKYLRIFLIIVLVFIVIIAILLLRGIFTDFVIIEVE